MAWPIYLYVPNIIGYLRIAACLLAFSVAFHDRGHFIALYLASFIGDYLDGRFALLLNQKSTFGAVLDMVTDRLGTACLLVLLSHLYRPHFLLFTGLICLDIASHWFQMYSSFLVHKTSHKDVSQRDFALMRLYYGHRSFMGYCCIGAEVMYLALYLLHEPRLGTNATLYDHARHQALSERWHTKFAICLCLGASSLPGWTMKQLINLVQMKQAADICVQHDLDRRRTGEEKKE